MSFARSLQSTSEAIGTSMVVSGSGLSLLDKPLDRKNRDVVCTYLKDLPHSIVAVWIAARPVSGVSNGFTFEHWCVKIQAPPSLLSIDFLESDGYGKFGLQVTTAMEAELQDFLMYYVDLPNEGRKRKKWRIVASATPSPLKNKHFKADFLDPHDLSTLKHYMKCREQAKKNKNNKNYKMNMNKLKNKNSDILLKKIKCSKKVCDIADFLEMWTEFEHKKKKNNKKDKPYNAVLYNCQQFAVHLFKYLVGTHYPVKVQDALKQTQSPADKRAFKKQNKNNQIDKPIESLSPKASHADDDYDNDDNNQYNGALNGALMEQTEPEEDDEKLE